jgi:hypothetical protein
MDTFLDAFVLMGELELDLAHELHVVLLGVADLASSLHEHVS